MGETKLKILVEAIYDGKGIKAAEKDVGGLEKATGKLTKVATGAFVGAGAAAIKFGADSIQAFNQFDKQMREVFTLLPGISDQAMGEMRSDVLELSREIGRTSDQVIPALYSSLSAGVPPGNVMDFLKVANQAALAGVVDLEVAVDVLTSSVNAYTPEILSAKQASDLLFTAVKGGKTTMGELGASMFQVTPTAAALGVEFGNVTAALASITSKGTPTATATVQLRGLLIELSKAGGKAAATFEKMAGKSFKDFIAEGGNLQDALMLMEEAAAQSNVSLSDLFSSVEAGNAALTLTGGGAAKFTQELEASQEAMGATAEAAETMSDATQQAVDEAAAAWEGFRIAMGESLQAVQGASADSQKGLLAWATTQTQVATATNRFRTALDRLGYSAVEIEVATGAAEKRSGEYWQTLLTGEGVAKRMDLALVLLTKSQDLQTASTRELSRELQRLTNLAEDSNLTVEDLADAFLLLEKGQAASIDEAIRLISVMNAAETRAEGMNTILARQYGIVYQDKEAIEELATSTGELSKEDRALIEQANTAEGAFLDLGVGTVQLAEHMINLRIEEEFARKESEQLTAVQEQLRSIANQTATAMQNLRQATADYFGEALKANDITGKARDRILEEAIAAGVSIDALKELALSTGNWTEGQIDAAAEAANMRVQQDLLGEAFINGRLTVDQLNLALGYLEDGIVGSADEARYMAQTELPGMQGAMDRTTTATLLAKEEVLGLTKASQEYADGSPYEATVDINDQATDDLMTIQDYLKGLQDKTVTVTTNYASTGNPPPGAGGYQGPPDAGGNIPPGGSTGGLIRGGIANRDSVLMRLMPGEFVLQKSAVQQFGVRTLHELNQGRAPSGALAMGGPGFGIMAAQRGERALNFQSNDKLIFIVNDRSAAGLVAAMAQQKRQQSVMDALNY